MTQGACEAYVWWRWRVLPYGSADEEQKDGRENLRRCEASNQWPGGSRYLFEKKAITPRMQNVCGFEVGPTLFTDVIIVFGLSRTQEKTLLVPRHNANWLGKPHPPARITEMSRWRPWSPIGRKAALHTPFPPLHPIPLPQPARECGGDDGTGA